MVGQEVLDPFPVNTPQQNHPLICFSPFREKMQGLTGKIAEEIVIGRCC